MLILARRIDERIIIDGGRVVIIVQSIERRRGDCVVKLGFEADPDVTIDREEVHMQKRSCENCPSNSTSD